MKVSLWTAFSLIAVALGAMMWWSQHDTARRLAQGDYRQIAYQVVSTRSAANRKIGSRLELTYTHPDTGQVVAANVPISPADDARGLYPPGKRGIAWIHPGFPAPTLGDSKPDLRAQGAFERRAGTALILVGIGMLVVLWKTGRLLG